MRSVQRQRAVRPQWVSSVRSVRGDGEGAGRVTLGTKWKPDEPVEFKHVVEVSERIGRMSDDSRLLGHVWNELQEAKGRVKTERARMESVWKCLAGADDETAVEHSTLLRARETVVRVAQLESDLARLKRDHVYATGTVCTPMSPFPDQSGEDGS